MDFCKKLSEIWNNHKYLTDEELNKFNSQQLLEYYVGYCLRDVYLAESEGRCQIIENLNYIEDESCDVLRDFKKLETLRDVEEIKRFGKILESCMNKIGCFINYDRPVPVFYGLVDLFEKYLKVPQDPREKERLNEACEKYEKEFYLDREDLFYFFRSRQSFLLHFVNSNDSYFMSDIEDVIDKIKDFPEEKYKIFLSFRNYHLMRL